MKYIDYNIKRSISLSYRNGVDELVLWINYTNETCRELQHKYAVELRLAPDDQIWFIKTTDAILDPYDDCPLAQYQVGPGSKVIVNSRRNYPSLHPSRENLVRYATIKIQLPGGQSIDYRYQLWTTCAAIIRFLRDKEYIPHLKYQLFADNYCIASQETLCEFGYNYNQANPLRLEAIYNTEESPVPESDQSQSQSQSQLLSSSSPKNKNRSCVRAKTRSKIRARQRT